MINSSETAKQCDSKSLDLALLALNELARRKYKKFYSFESTDVQNFCDAIIAKNDHLQIELIETLIKRGVSLKTVYEVFIPEVAETLGNLWKESRLTFVEVSIGAQRLQRLSRIYEKRYLGPMYVSSEGPEILLILPKKEIHTLGLITASGIFKKNGANPFVAVGYSDQEIMNIINLKNFKLIGISVSNSENIPDCLRIGTKIRSYTSVSMPLVIGGQGIIKKRHPELSAIFDQITINPVEALGLITDENYN